MDFNGLLLAAAIWLLVGLLGRSRSKRPPPRAPGRRPLPPASPTAPDATQREGRRLELVLREFERALDQAGPLGRGPRIPLPESDDVENRESLEVEPEAGTLETDIRRASRQTVDQDDEVEQVIARRINAAAVRDEARTEKDHLEFDSRIRQEPADKTATPRYTVQQLRDAVVWREILGPPVSER